jgi:phosphatidylglycerophosphate synthase
MLDELLRLPKEKVLLPLAQAMPGLSPTAVTLTAALVGIAAGAAAAGQQYGLALGLWLLNRFLDGLDGTLARTHHRQSDLGGYLDIVLDLVVYAAIPLGLALGGQALGPLRALAMLLSSFYVNGATWLYLAALLEKRNQGAQARGELTAVTMPSGLIEGFETFILYCLFLIFPNRITELFSLMAILVLVTAIQRVVWAIRHLKS